MMGGHAPGMNWISGITIFILSLISPIATSVIPPLDSEVFSKSVEHGAVASESSICSDIGIDLLKRGVSKPVPTSPKPPEINILSRPPRNLPSTSQLILKPG